MFCCYEIEQIEETMPKQVYDEFLRSLRRDIQTGYKRGDRYLSVREISEKFNVCLQTAQKGVKELSQDGLISSRPRAGIVVEFTSTSKKSLEGKKIIVMSNKQDGHFFYSFHDGVKSVATPLGIKTQFLLNTFTKTDSLDFGSYLASLEADGLILLSFPMSELPIYHAIREGCDIVSDIILDRLPILPARQTDNYQHSYEAGKMLLAEGCTSFCVIGTYKEKNKRLMGFNDAIATAGYTSTYIQLTSSLGIGQVSEALMNLTPTTGIFISDYSSAYVVDSLCSRDRVIPKHILVYDTDGEMFISQYLPPIRAVGPSFTKLGAELGNCLIYKWLNGAYEEPLQKKI